MFKVIFILSLGLFSLQAAQVSCSSCAIGKDMVKCDYYVIRKHDLKYQKNCLAYAKSIDRDGMHAKAAWYYLLGGDKESAKRCSKKALDMGQHYAAEYKGLVDIAENNIEDAKKELSFFKHKVKNVDYAKKDIEALKYIYKDFNEKAAYEILYK